MRSVLEHILRWKRIFVLTFITMPLFTYLLIIGKYIYRPIMDMEETKIESVMSVTHYSREDYINSVFSYQYIKVFYNGFLAEINKTVRTGQKAPNEVIVSHDGKTYKKLLDLQEKDRPLVLNFGSCSLPPFVAKLPIFKRVVDEFSDAADFVTIYVVEAHPIDGWFFPGNDYKIMSHSSLKERIDAAAMLIDLKPHTPVWVDTMADACNKEYSACPERLVVIQNGIVVHDGRPGPEGYKPAVVQEILNKMFKS